VLVFSSTGTLLNTFGQNISYPWACTITSSSQIVVNGANIPSSINFINPTSGAVTQVLDSTLAGGTELLGMAQSPDGRIFVGALNLGIYVFSSTGVYQGIISSPSVDIYSYSMAFTSASNGLLYVCDIFNDRIVTFAVGNSGIPGSNSAVSAHSVSSAVFALAAIVFTLFITL